MSKQSKKSIVELLSEDERFNLEVITDGGLKYAEGSFGATKYFTDHIAIGRKFCSIAQVFDLESLADGFIFEDLHRFMAHRSNIDEVFNFLKESQNFAIRKGDILESRERIREHDILVDKWRTTRRE